MRVEAGIGRGIGTATRTAGAAGPRSFSGGSPVESRSSRSISKGNSFSIGISPEGKVSSPKQFEIKHTFGSGKDPHPVFSGKGFSLDTRPGNIDMRDMKIIAKPSVKAPSRAENAAKNHTTSTFSTRGLRTEWRRTSDISVTYPVKERTGPAGSTQLTPHTENSVRTSSQNPPETNKIKSGVEQSKALPPQPDRTLQNAGEVQQHAFTREQAKSGKFNPIQESKLDIQPKMDGRIRQPEQASQAESVVKEQLHSKDFKGLRKSLEKSSTARVVNRKDVTAIAKAYLEKNKQLTENQVLKNVEIGNARLTENQTLNNKENKLKNLDELANSTKVLDSANAELMYSARIYQLAKELQASAPAGSDLAKIDPLAIGVTGYAESTKNKGILTDAITQEVQSQLQTEQEIAHQQSEVTEVTQTEQEALTESLPESIQQSEFAEATRQTQIASLKEEIMSIQQDLMNEDEHTQIGFEFVVDEEANHARMLHTLAAAQVIFQANTTYRQPIATGSQIVSIMPSESRPVEAVQSGIVKGLQYADGSYSEYLSDIYQGGVFNTL